MTNLQIIKELESIVKKLVVKREFCFLNPLDCFNYKLNSNNKVIELELTFQEIKTRNLKLIGKLTSLEKLDLSYNQITTIDWWLHDLVNLEKIKLSNNQITTTQGLEKLTKLEELELSYNQITKIQGLDSLVSLQYLNLSKNNIPEKEIKEFRDKHPKIIVL